MIVYSLDVDLKARLGILAYWWQGAREVFRYNFPHFRIVIGDQKLDASLAIVGRTKNYGGPFKITTGADLFEDQFETLDTDNSWTRDVEMSGFGLAQSFFVLE